MKKDIPLEASDDPGYSHMNTPEFRADVARLKVERLAAEVAQKKRLSDYLRNLPDRA
jgi:hypothetical protein